MTRYKKPPLPDYARKAIIRKKTTKNPKGGKQAKEEWWKFHKELYSSSLVREAIKMGFKPINEQLRLTQMSDENTITKPISYVDPYTGEIVELAPEAIRNLDETEFFKKEKAIWPDLEKVDFDTLLGLNVLLLETKWMRPNQYGAYFALRLHVDGKHVTTLAPGEVINNDLAKMSGIRLSDGEHDESGKDYKIFPVWVTFGQMINKTNPDRAYWNMIPAFVPVEKDEKK